ncbi:DNA polymerase III subunit gamma and tau [Nocardioides ochotonae]|uniref:DNA polymerase III subunit gamma and tau n=1 Tax=Nocardioides ochotonae TaxID=2685869 RepID=UPI001409A4B5|nr:DNA polymerase III subunit gamma and tau [Nocardioides ochotonae]
MESPLALYRRYRPETFAEVIGQDHVTGPLRAALANNRVNHAYLFSGPRGCGKTTSARILARALNCEKAPVADPCGECESCRDLSRGGGGSIDVIEIDAASHGGVDDARDLREKAFFAPVKSRYKVYIIDEAHMVSPQGFNALLKLVEEPPPHLRFIFATTEPEKVIPTIRSRTHHYPFRLIPPRLLSSYLSELAAKEGVAIEPVALPLIVRAGGGSARDTLSVLDQLLGGSGPEGVTHELATGLLGYTPDTLLDEVVDAFAAGDGAAVFGVVDKVIETGQDPRRFTEDLLRRLRDLVIVAAVPEATVSGLIDVSEDQGERLVAQAARFGSTELSRAADLVATGLTEMRGATAPRLLLELICARVLLPGADHSTEGVMARLDRLEKRLTITGTPSAAARPASPPAPPAQDRPADVHVAAERHPEAAAPPAPAPAAVPPASQQPAPPQQAAQQAPQPPAAQWSTPAVPGSAPAAQPAPQPPAPQQAAPAPPEAQPAAQPAPPQSAASGGLSLVEVRRLWPDIVEATKLRRRVAWMILTQNCQVVGLEGNVLTVGFSNVGARDSFVAGGCDAVLRQAAIDVVGADWRIETIIDAGTQVDASRPAAPAPAAPAPPADTAPQPAPSAQQQPQPAADAPAGTDQAPEDRAPRAPDHDPIHLARQAVQPTRAAGIPEPAAAEDTVDRDADARRDDLDADLDEVGGAELLQRELGAKLIEEIRHQ